MGKHTAHPSPQRTKKEASKKKLKKDGSTASSFIENLVLIGDRGSRIKQQPLRATWVDF
jgi:hypothetical protein